MQVANYMVRDLARNCMTAELLQPDELVSGLMAQVRISWHASGPPREMHSLTRTAPQLQATLAGRTVSSLQHPCTLCRKTAWDSCARHMLLQTMHMYQCRY